MLQPAVISGLLTVALTGAASSVLADTPPVAPIKPVTNTYWGTAVVDPYQWMENEKDPEFQSWMKGQNDYTRQVLTNLPGKNALQKRIEALSSASTVVYQVGTAGEYYFYFKRAPSDDNSKLYVRKGLKGEERLLVDPEKMGTKDVHYSIDYFV
ncbi:MAG: S9 family peptidase, partial [Burkholderiales bacterium]|nr:S9 family peptidase [Burkholderiales bacterium]